MSSIRMKGAQPDAHDVAQMIEAVQAYHGVTVVVKIDRDYAAKGHYLVVCVEAHTTVLLDNGRYLVLSKSTRYPFHAYATLEVCLFNLLHLLDSACARQCWKQTSLDELLPAS